MPAPNALAACKGLLLSDIVNKYRLLAGAEPKPPASARKLSATMAGGQWLRKQNPLISLIRADVLPIEMQMR